jgi:hypothetical protein
MTAPHLSRAALEARLDALQEIFTGFAEYRGLDGEDIEALFWVGARRAQPRHYERLESSEAGRTALKELERGPWGS